MVEAPLPYPKTPQPPTQAERQEALNAAARLYEGLLDGQYRLFKPAPDYLFVTPDQGKCDKFARTLRAMQRELQQ